MGDMVIRSHDSMQGAKVSDDSRLLGSAITESQIEHSSEKNGQAFSWTTPVKDPDAGDTIIAVKNTSNDKLLVISVVTLSSDIAVDVVIHAPVIDTPTGTAITPASLNRSFLKVAEATAIADETTNSQANIVYKGRIPASTPTKAVERVGVILGTNDSIAVDYVQDVTTADVVVEGFFADPEELD